MIMSNDITKQLENFVRNFFLTNFKESENINRYFSFFGLLICLFSCNNKSAENKKFDGINFYYREYYPNGILKKETKYIDTSLLNKDITCYHTNGVISKKFKYLNDKVDGEFITYDDSSRILSRGYFNEGIPIGPSYYFTNGSLDLYNERDLHNEVYYVKKYNSITHSLIKEEGVCLSTKPFYKKSDNEQELYFSYAQPDGYINELKAEKSGQPIKFDTLKGHLGLIKLKVPNDIGKVVKIFSILKFNSQIICRDSLQEFIH